jgi:hypothetical protein
MKRSEITTITPHYTTYTNKVEDIELTEALEKYGKPLLQAERERLISLGDKIYAPGKWTAKDIIQHVIDAERVFSYRAMRFARNDKTPLPSFDENIYALIADARERELDDLLEEFYSVRESTTRLFKSFTPEMLRREGEVWSGTMSVIALGFTITGHLIHHIGVLKDKYYS